MHAVVPTLISTQDVFIRSKESILKQWVSYEVPKNILVLHHIDETYFLKKYASGVFDYFMGVISGEVEIGNCPVMKELLAYLKNREISADELFAICSHFRRAMVDFTYDAQISSKELFDEISYIFDENFKGILKFYTDTIFQKLIDARQEALRASQAKEYFLSNMSHEIRTPLNAILGFVNLLLDEDILKKHRNYLDIIHDSGENLLSIINDILDFSKLRSGEFNIEKKPFSIHEELSHTMELFVASANAKDITITSFIDPLIPVSLNGDALRIKQILSNFLSNAIKFTQESGIINIEVTCVKQVLDIRVTDNGVGIKDEDLEKIFSAFAQAEYSVYTHKDGTGLGLSICSQLAEKMGGEVGVESEVGKGSTFYIKLPTEIHLQEGQEFGDISEFQKLKMVVYAKHKDIGYKHLSFIRYAEVFQMNVTVVDSLEEEFDICIFVHEECDLEFKKKMLKSDKKFIAMMSREYDDYISYKHIHIICFPLYCAKMYMAFKELVNPHVQLEYAHRISTTYSGHILIVEDNEANQELIKILLTKYGLTYDLANNGLEGFELYKKNDYDLILMDEQMPIMNGNESATKIIEYEQSIGKSHTPISALTANVVKGARERGLEGGFDAFLGKPVILKELEKVFATYLKIDHFVSEKENSSKDIEDEKIVGLDVEKLSRELMLTNEELLMLLKLFIKKMNKTMPELQTAIFEKDYTKVALLSHSVKGSSGNFRIKVLQDISSEMEQMAKEENEGFEYEKALETMMLQLSSINIE
ncbi:MAG: ATP-binding protein [Campylobacterota bacterium]|nr:ATP-binding protein [Campylobacterota bacterium]